MRFLRFVSVLTAIAAVVGSTYGVLVTTDWNRASKLYDEFSSQALPLPEQPLSAVQQEEPRLIARMKSSHRSIWAMAITPDGRMALTAGTGPEDIVSVWDLTRRREIFQLRGHDQVVTAVAISRDGRRGVSGGRDRKVIFWDLEQGIALRTMRGHSWPVTSVDLSPDGKYAISGGDHFRCWDLETGKVVRRYQRHRGSVQALAFSADGEKIISGGLDSTARIWQSANARSLALLGPHKGRVRVAQFTPDGLWAVTAGTNDEIIRVWDVEMGEELITFDSPGVDGMTAVAISPDGQLVVFGQGSITDQGYFSDDGKARKITVFDVLEHRQTAEMPGHSSYTSAIEFLPGGKQLITAGGDEYLKVWELPR